MLRPVLVLLLLSTTAAHNNATESINSQPQLHLDEQPAEEEGVNQASRRGRWPPEAAASDGLEQSQVGCRELRSTKYISDGHCTSVKPVKELVCAGECLPNRLLPNWIGGGRYWGRHGTQWWRCIIDRTRTQRIQLECNNNSTRTYKITVVTSCKCKRYSREQNQPARQDTPGPDGRPRKNQDRAVPLKELTQSHN